MSESLRLLGTSGGIDQTGIASVDVPIWVPTLDDALRVTYDIGLPILLVSRSFKQSEEGGYEVTLRFEGKGSAAGGGVGGGDAPKDDETTFEFDVSLSEDPIESHPSFERIAEKYGWDETEKKFPKLAPNAVDAGASALGKKPATQKNPLYGTESYLSVGAVFRKTYAVTRIPPGVLRGIGSIVTSPPGSGQLECADTGNKRNWLKLAPKIRRRGNSVEVTEEWMLSGPNGWNTDIYSGGQLEDSDGGL